MVRTAVAAQSETAEVAAHITPRWAKAQPWALTCAHTRCLPGEAIVGPRRRQSAARPWAMVCRGASRARARRPLYACTQEGEGVSKGQLGFGQGGQGSLEQGEGRGKGAAAELTIRSEDDGAWCSAELVLEDVGAVPCHAAAST